MLIFLHGVDSYRRGEKLKSLAGEYRVKNKETDFLEIDLGESPEEWERARDFLVQPSLFISKKLAIVRECGAITEAAGFSKEAVKSWREAVRKAAFSEEGVFLIISDMKKPFAGFKFLLETPVKHQEFEDLKGERLRLFLTREAKKRGVVFDLAALGFLAGYVGGEKTEKSWLAVNLLEQVSLAGFPSPISLNSLKELVSWSDYGDMLSLSSGFLRANFPERRILYLENLFLRGEAARHILNLISSLARGGREVIPLARYDELIKSGRLDDETALLGFAVGG